MAQSQSPIIKKLKNDELDFPSAIKEIIAGNKVSRREWPGRGDYSLSPRTKKMNSEEYFGILKDDKLKLHKPDGQFYDWIISDGDLLAKDWFVIE